MPSTTISAAGAHASAASTDRIPASKAGVKGYLTPTQLGTLLFSSPTLVTPALGTPASGVLTNCTGLLVSSLVPTATNDSAAAGKIGELIESTVLSGAAVSLTTGTAADVTSISLTAGDWDVWGSIATIVNAATLQTRLDGWISATATTFPTPPNGGAIAGIRAAFETGIAQFLPVGMTRISVASTTTIYLGVRVNFTVNTCAGYGYIGARRVR